MVLARLARLHFRSRLVKHSLLRVGGLTVLQMAGLQVKLEGIKKEGQCWAGRAFLRNADDNAVSTGCVKTSRQSLPPSLLVERLL